MADRAFSRVACRVMDARQEGVSVDEQRKHAYRNMLYWAMLDIRTIQWLRWGRFQGWNPFTWRRDERRVRCAGAIADWLHNLAWFSSVNFQGFDADWFWRDFESVRSQFPKFGLERFRERFLRETAPPPEGPSVT